MPKLLANRRSPKCAPLRSAVSTIQTAMKEKQMSTASVSDETREGGTIQCVEHAGIVVDDIEAATAFFVALGLELQGEGMVEGEWVDRVVGLESMRVTFAMLGTVDGRGAVELVKFHSPPARRGDGDAPANTLGIRHLAFRVVEIDAAVATVVAHGGALIGEVVNYEGIYRLCYVRGPEGIIVELAERIG